MRRFKGFTLTELMVALAVIGILVAVVTPAIMKTRPNKNKMMVKKTYYAVEQIVSSLINDEILYPDMRTPCRTGENNRTNKGDGTTGDIYCAWGFDYVYGTSFEGEVYEGANKFGALFKSRLNVRNNSGNADGKAPRGTDYYPVFFTADGVKWDLSGTTDAWDAVDSGTGDTKPVGTFDDNDPASHTKDKYAGMGTITIDVNGDEAPNAFFTVDPENWDRYRIEILANGKMRIHPADEKAIEWTTINTSIRDGIQ